LALGKSADLREACLYAINSTVGFSSSVEFQDGPEAPWR
jgi:hypothetical protein